MTQTTDTQRIEQLFELGAHLGHRKSRLHPRSRRYVYTIVNGTSIIDLTKTVTQIDEAKKFLAKAAKEGKIPLVVATKKIASAYIKDFCAQNEIHYVTSKWLPGLISNFETIMKNVQKLTSLKDQEVSGAWDSLVKHERVKLSKQVSKLTRLYGGLVGLSKRPDFLIIIDAKKEKNAVQEARAAKIPIVALLDTISNPDLVNHPVMANDDTAQVIEHIMQDLLETFQKAKAN